jgi:hypothetical protein
VTQDLADVLGGCPGVEGDDLCLFGGVGHVLPGLTRCPASRAASLADLVDDSSSGELWMFFEQCLDVLSREGRGVD